MKHRRIIGIAIILFFAAGCFPAVEVGLLERDELSSEALQDIPTKVHVLDASVILFPRGCVVEGNTLTGIGSRHWLEHEDNQMVRRTIPLDSIAAVTYYDTYYNAGRVFAQGWFGIFAPIMTFLGVYCAINPKSCFGSCPTVYTYESSGPVLEAELFSSSISRQMEADDLDVILAKPDEDGTFAIRVTNEALETHFINQFQLLSVEHPANTHVLPGPDNEIIVVNEPHPPAAAKSRTGEDVLSTVTASDDVYYRSGDAVFSKLMKGNKNDWIDVSVDVPPDVEAVRMVLRIRNSLLSTVLFYDLVLGSQGIGAVAWTHKLSNDPVYAALFTKVYHSFSGVKVLSVSDGSLKQVASITDVGPINWKNVAVEIPVDNPGEFTVRLQFFPDNIFIDYVGFDVSATRDRPIAITELSPLFIIDNEGRERSDILPFLTETDEKYFITEPGDSYRLMYDISRPEHNEQTLLIRSHGYYTEWIRGGWLKQDGSDYKFDLFDTKSTLSELSKRWISGRQTIENTFFNSRIPVREER